MEMIFPVFFALLILFLLIFIKIKLIWKMLRLQIRADTELKNFPLYCPKCRQEGLIDAKDLQVTVIKRIEAKMQDFKQ